MTNKPDKPQHSSRLLQVMIIFSIVIHVPVLMHIAGIYRSEALSYIEFTLQEVAKPFTRSIPRPRSRVKPPEMQEVKKLTLHKQRIPKIDINKVDDNLPDTLMESISVPEGSDGAAVGISHWDPGAMGSFVNRDDYFEMVRLKIESKKRYPSTAKNRQIEGRVGVRFVITTDGFISSVELTHPTKYDPLNQAALNALRAASPLPPPPHKLFSGPVSVEMVMRFELT
jgi:protein TonB